MIRLSLYVMNMDLKSMSIPYVVLSNCSKHILELPVPESIENWCEQRVQGRDEYQDILQ